MEPIPQPGIELIPGFTARKLESFVMKGRSMCGSKGYTISWRQPNDDPGQLFIDVQQPHRKEFVFVCNGQVVMRMEKKTHVLSSPEWFAYSPEGQQVFMADLKIQKLGFRSDDMEVQTSSQHPISIDRGSKGMTIFCGGQVVATQHHPNKLSLGSRKDFIDVAPGMDMLLALGLMLVHVDKQKSDQRAATTTVVTS